MEDKTTTTTEQPQTTERWVCLEIFGHRQHFGRLTEIEQFGAKFARIETFCSKGHALLAPTYAGAAIFSVTDLTGGEAEARRRTGAYDCTNPECKAATPALLSWSDDDDEPDSDGGEDVE